MAALPVALHARWWRQVGIVALGALIVLVVVGVHVLHPVLGPRVHAHFVVLAHAPALGDLVHHAAEQAGTDGHGLGVVDLAACHALVSHRR